MKKKLLVNTITSFMYQIVYMIYGFVLPKLILDAYGSEINGLVSSINQYLSVISLTEFGMTTVIQSSLYKPLVENDCAGISRVLTSSSRFFRRIAALFIIYIVVLCIGYPVFVTTSFGNMYVASLILILSLNMLVEYVFGITSKQLIIADQNIYFCQIINTVTVVLNTACCFFLIRHHVSLHILKLCTAGIMVLNSIAALLFVRVEYPKVNFRTTYDKEPIKQKWNGVAQHLSAYIYSSTDVIVLTLLSSLKNVSVYAVYNMVLNGLRQLTGVFDNAVRPIMGRLWAKNDSSLYKYFNAYEIVTNTLSVFVFGCAASLIVPFVQLYTATITDTNYVVPKFAFLFTLAYLLQNIKNPYHTLIQSTGKFRETQNGYIITAVLNICISVALVFKYGLIGVAVGTLTAAFFQLGYLFVYTHKNIFKNHYINSLKVYAVDIVVFLIDIRLLDYINFPVDSAFKWVVFAIIVALVWGVSLSAVLLLIYRQEVYMFCQKIVLKSKANRS